MKVILSDPPLSEWKTLDKFKPGDVVVAKAYDASRFHVYLVIQNFDDECNTLVDMTNLPALNNSFDKTSLFRLFDKLEMDVRLP